MAIWNPWRGCHKKSEGCDNCYIHRADANKGIDTNLIYRTDEFYKPIEKDKKGNYKIKSGQTVFLCFNSDFLIDEADAWRAEAWEMIKERSDLNFLFLTKRIERFLIGLPADYGHGYDHVTVCVSVENQIHADERVKLLKEMPIKHKMVVIQPMLESVNLMAYLDSSIEQVIVGGESGKDVRPLDFEWVLDVRRQCMQANVNFEFRQIGSVFIKNGLPSQFQRQYLCAQARLENINFVAL